MDQNRFGTPRGSHGVPCWRQGCVLERLGGRPGAVLGRLGGDLVANMAPSGLPKWSQNPEKIDAKIDGNFDTCWERILNGF